MRIVISSVTALLLSALPAVSQPLPLEDNLPSASREAGLEFEGFGTPNTAKIDDIVYQGECPGEEQGSLKARFYSTTTPPGPGLRVVIRNMSRGLVEDKTPFTDRDYSKGRTSQSTSVQFGTRHRSSHFIMLEGQNDLEYEIKQGDRSIEQGTFTAELSRGEKRRDRNAYCYTEEYCRGSENTPLDKCKKVRTRTRCSCPDGNTFIQGNRGFLVKLCRARFN